jgi:hypothetical protein
MFAMLKLLKRYMRVMACKIYHKLSRYSIFISATSSVFQASESHMFAELYPLFSELPARYAPLTAKQFTIFQCLRPVGYASTVSIFHRGRKSLEGLSASLGVALVSMVGWCWVRMLKILHVFYDKTAWIAVLRYAKKTM